MICCDPKVTRRALLQGGGALTAWAMAPRVASAAGARDPRLLVIVLRGALDGLATVVPQGDPAWARLRDDANLRGRGGPEGGVGLPLDDLFVLNPALSNLHALYRARQALFVHAVATPYRARSHFDGQQVLESGLAGVSRDATGWLNRMLVALEPDADPTPVDGTVERARGLMIGQSVPLILRGPAPVMAWSTSAAATGDPDTAERLLSLYDRTAPAFHTALAQSLEARRLAGGMGGVESELKGLAGRFSRMATGAGRLLAARNGPRIASLSFDGWDTHANEGPVAGQLAQRLTAFDAAVAALRETMRDVWADTIVLAVTEFGRTAHENGNDGTDHGTGTVAMMFGGAVKGGRVVADWPGLAPAALWENRDLAPTADLRGVLKGVGQDLFGLSPSVLDRDVFPGSDGVDAMHGLLG